MAHRLAVLSVTAILILVALLATAPTVGRAAASTPGPVAAEHPEIPVISVVTTNVFGYYVENSFQPGTSNAAVYFYITDPADDNNVTVHINDVNAARDGLTNPVASWVVNASAGDYFSGTLGVQYTIPSSVVYSGDWNVTASGAVGGNDSYTFTVQTFTLWAHATPEVLAGNTGWVTYYVNSTAGGAAYSHISQVNVSAVYLDGTTGKYAPLNLSQNSWGSGMATGTATFLLPLNASEAGWVYFNVWANVTGSANYSTHFNTSSQYSTAIANYDGIDVWAYSSAGEYVAIPNQLVYVYLEPYMISARYGETYAPGITMYISFWAWGAAVPASAVPGNPPAVVVSPASSYSFITFLASPTVFSTTALNFVNVSVVAAPSVNGSAIGWDNESAPFSLEANGSSLVGVSATYAAGEYYGGQSVSLNWSLVPLLGAPLTGWSAQSYAVTASGYYSSPISVASGYLTGTSGTITFTAPANYNGELWTSITAQNGSAAVESTFEVNIVSAGILVIPTVQSYTPGQSFVVNIRTEGSGFAGATIFYGVYDYDTDSELSTGTVTGTAFTVTMPSQGVPYEVEIYVWAQSPTLGTFAQGSDDLEESSLLDLQVGISTISHYSDGSFQPGQTITVTWSATMTGAGAGTSMLWAVYLWNTNGWDYDSPPLAHVVTGNLSGSFSYTIPSGSPAGQQTLYVSMGAYMDCDYDSCYGANSVSYSVNPSPSVLNYELGAGSGLTVGWLILLLVIIVVAVVLVLMMRRGRSPKSPPSAFTATQPMSPPAPAPSTSPPAEWKEGSGDTSGSSTGAGDGQPPLPTPPSGSQ
jgi:hypothetical protein